MKNFYLAFLAYVLAAVVPAVAQIVTSSPAPLQESSTGVVLTFNAASSLSNKGLYNLSDASAVYAHIGVLTNKSTSTGDWQYVVTPWPTSGNDQAANTDKNRLTKVDANTYTLAIGDIRTYFGITDSNVKVEKLVMVFRTADGKRECKTADGGDITLDVVPEGFAMDFTQDFEGTTINADTKVTYVLQTTQAADLVISVNGTKVAEKSNATELSATYDFTARGIYNIVATATKGSEVLEQTLQMNYSQPSPAQDYPGSTPVMGTVRNDDGTVTFCLAAPGKTTAMLIGAWNDYMYSEESLMKYQDYEGNRYFWTTVSGLKDDVWYPYYYCVDDTYNVADPYAHLILDCWSDKYERPEVWPDRPLYPYDRFSNVMMGVYRGDIDDYTFSPFDIPDHDNLVIYEMLFRDFTGVKDGLAGGVGTVRAAIDKIPYLKDLGFNAVELMPIMEFNGTNSWGYNTNFYFAPDKSYGSPTDYKDFIEACHREGIAVILDIVFNQSDGLHPWYQLYPIASNPFYNQTAPHDYSVLNDWNQDNALVQQQWTDALRYWLTAYNVDGFRFDLVKGLGDNSSYKNGTEAYNQSRVDRMKRLHSVITSVKPKGIHINEDLAGAKEEIELGNDGQLQWANVNWTSCQFAMGWDDGDNDLSRFLATADGGRPWGSTVSYAESHDEQRVGYKCGMWGNGAIKTDLGTMCSRLGTLAVQMLMTPGPKMVWMFGELGDQQNAKNEDDSNNTAPKMVDWTMLNDPDRAYLHDTYRAAIQLRMRNPELFGRDAIFSAPSLKSKFSVMRTMRLATDDKEIIVFINPAVSGAAKTVNASSSIITPDSYQLAWASPGFEPVLTGTGNSLSVQVPAGSYAIFTSESTTGTAVIDRPSGATAIGGTGTITIAGVCTALQVSDLAGRVITTDATAQRITVPAGLYLVTLDGHTTKVAVR